MEVRITFVYVLMVILSILLIVSYVYMGSRNILVTTIITGVCTFLWTAITSLYFMSDPDLVMPFLFINQGLVIFVSLYSIGVSHVNVISLA